MVSRLAAWRKEGGLCLVRFGFLLLPASTYRSGPKVFTFLANVDDSDQPYAVYIPDQFDPNPRNFRSCVRATALFASFTLSLSCCPPATYNFGPDESSPTWGRTTSDRLDRECLTNRLAKPPEKLGHQVSLKLAA